MWVTKYDKILLQEIKVLIYALVDQYILRNKRLGNFYPFECYFFQ